MRNLKGIGSWLTSHYDKIIALIVFLGLVVSLLYLAVQVGLIQRSDEAFKDKYEGLSPKHPEAEEVSPDNFEKAVDQIRNPFVFSDWKKDLLVPEARVWCIDCQSPISIEAKKCPFCGKDQPRIDEFDVDFDGIKDEHEKLLGLNPNDKTDVMGDKDGDGFSNIDEYRYYVHKGMDIKGVIDKAVYPPIEPFLFIDKSKGDPRNPGLHADPFHLLFKSYMKWGERMRFQLNTREGGNTHFVFRDEEVEGFIVVGFDKKFEAPPNPGGIKKEVSTLTLKRGSRTIKLKIGREEEYDEYVAFMVFKLDDKTYEVSMGDVFELRPGKKYEVISIVDTPEPRIVIQRLTDRKKFTVGGDPAHTTE